MIYLSLGSNLGDRMEHIRRAIELLGERCLTNISYSIAIETKAQLPEGAPPSWNKPYLNAIVRGETALSISELFQQLKTIERIIGRPAIYEKWSPRVIDLDILLWGGRKIDLPTLHVPHKELLNRPFLIHLLAMMDPLLDHQGTTFAAIAARTPDIENSFDKSFALFPRLVGIVNVTPDSFSDGSLYIQPEEAIKQALSLSNQGAAVIEIGAQSTRPSAPLLSPTEEYSRLKPVLEGLQESQLTLSLDSFRPSVILEALEQFPLSWVNDVTGKLDEETLRTIAGHGCKIVVMHSLSVPPRKDMRLNDELDPLTIVTDWAKTTIHRLQQFGFHQKDIILDPGIGFGKSAYQSLFLLRRLKELQSLGCPLLAGHSRKSYITAFHPSLAKERDLETAALSSLLAAQAIDFLRVHNIAIHHRLLAAQQSFHGFRLGGVLS